MFNFNLSTLIDALSNLPKLMEENETLRRVNASVVSANVALVKEISDLEDKINAINGERIDHRAALEGLAERLAELEGADSANDRLAHLERKIEHLEDDEDLQRAIRYAVEEAIENINLEDWDSFSELQSEVRDLDDKIDQFDPSERLAKLFKAVARELEDGSLV